MERGTVRLKWKSLYSVIMRSYCRHRRQNWFDLRLCFPLVECPAGSYYNRDSQTCETCQEGSFQNRTGQLSCDACPAGKWSVGGHAKNFTECIGKFSNLSREAVKANGGTTFSSLARHYDSLRSSSVKDKKKTENHWDQGPQEDEKVEEEFKISNKNNSEFQTVILQHFSHQ